MRNQWILVTGGSRGIGRATVLRLAKQWNVVFTWCRDESAAHEVELLCKALPGKVEGYQCDGCDEQTVTGLAADLLARYGAPYALVHNAGITLDALYIHQSPANWRKVMDTNLNAIFYWNHVLLEHMMMQGTGSIVMMSSVSGVKGNSGQSAYAASKAAMIGLARTLSVELGRFGIRVNCLLPGYIDTQIMASIPNPKLVELRKKIPLKRFGKVAEVAGAVAWLVSDDSAYMTGQTLILDGGLSA
ncbi:SDR family NAD(P)-dependent oxidoreductase [Pantoea ananatis]|uniref:SDR family NAD(P)-dependent oxidoreductase n=1 Tax=Pantoea ananas TaxID=553 RepID=UPI00051D3231|nr:SDR family oxidoreductase [Pantoea ananatis]KGL57069.1 3-oxoacyl-ACP reductase [Pantoea ananatis]MCW0330195.1 3-oxoacyl-[acyl-carrier-protein] reductase FabG [Pantoea ananatis]MCW0349179.1 3-oxoacyl-[acyl-carrier-protein] reductase FabG [Pantoea ananatis]QZE28776.1 SDR family oxidoreductase [Pantoea ananatis]